MDIRIPKHFWGSTSPLFSGEPSREGVNTDPLGNDGWPNFIGSLS